MHDHPAFRPDTAAVDSAPGSASSSPPLPLRHRNVSPVSGVASGRLRLVTGAFGVSAGAKTVAVLVLIVADLLNAAPVEKALARSQAPAWWPLLALVGVAASWMTYGMLRNRQRAAIFAAGIPTLLGLVAAAQSGGAGIGAKDLVVSVLMLIMLVSVRHELE